MICGCIELETPKSILEDDLIDIFDGTHLGAKIPEEYRDEVRTAMWARFRFRALGHPDRDYWLQCLYDRCDAISGRYIEAFDVYAKYCQSEYTDLAESSTEVQYIHEDTPDTAIGTASQYMSSRDTTKAKGYAGLPQSTLKQALGDLQDPYAMFAREFDMLFRVVMD